MALSLKLPQTPWSLILVAVCWFEVSSPILERRSGACKDSTWSLHFTESKHRLSVISCMLCRRSRKLLESCLSGTDVNLNSPWVWNYSTTLVTRETMKLPFARRPEHSMVRNEPKRRTQAVLAACALYQVPSH